MYDLVYKSIEITGVAEKLPEPEWQNKLLLENDIKCLWYDDILMLINVDDDILTMTPFEMILNVDANIMVRWQR